MTVNQPSTGLKSVRDFLEMIKFEHSIFALPYAMIGMIWAADGWPGFKIFFLILLAMVSCRTAAMAFNRITDRDIDAKNDRTKMRAIPAGTLRLRQVHFYFGISCVIFLIASALLNPLTLILSPIALFATLFYSRTKRYTWLCHFWLGASLGIAPVASWIAVRGSIDPWIGFLFLSVLFWTAGFDIIYALQDEEFDRENGLHSVPERFGKAKALTISRVSHFLSIVFLSIGLLHFGGSLMWLALAFSAGMLVYEQSLVKPNDLSRVNMAFFTLNGLISIGVFAFVLLERLLGSKTA